MINSNNHCDYSDKMQKCQDYIHALQEEHKKIQVFQRELPLCLELVTQAIEACKQRFSGTSTEYNLHGESECSEQISSEGPTLEEFIPIKRALSTSDDDDDDDEDKSQKPNNKNSKNTDEKSSKKSDWLRSVGLWNQTPNPTPEEDLPKKKSSGAFHPFKREKSVGTESTTAQGVTNRSVPLPPEAANSTAEKGGGSKKGGPSERKARRTWSPELHKRFLQALEQLGGSHVATPKQIREFMKVDGLTNDEVKSHLQKYRLHTRRSPNHSLHSNNNPQQPQFVVVGGIWVPPPEYAAMATTTASWEASGVSTTSNRIYTPIAKLPTPFPGTSTSPKRRQQHKRVCSDDRGSHSEGGDFHSHSPAGSCSTHTTNTLSTH